MKYIIILFFLLILTFSFKKQSNNLIIYTGKTISERFLAPNNFIREKVEVNSFAQYLRELPLKKHGSEVYLYNKKLKTNQNAHIAVVDKPILNVDLQQCADAVIRCRAEYLFKTKQYDKINFNFTNGFNASYIKWRNGYKINVSGNKVTWVKTAKPDTTLAGFNHYLKMVYNYCGSLSLSKQLKRKPFLKLEIGDVLLIGGSPGHAELVVDKVVNQKTNEFKFLLLQSYMPAQEMQILKNNDDLQNSPWYSSSKINFNIITPEYNFTTENLYCFE